MIWTQIVANEQASYLLGAVKVNRSFPSVTLFGEDFTEGQLSDSARTQEKGAVFPGNFAQVTRSELGALNVGQAVNVELELFETGGNLGVATLAGGRHDRPPTRPLELESDKIYYVNQRSRFPIYLAAGSWSPLPEACQFEAIPPPVLEGLPQLPVTIGG